MADSIRAVWYDDRGMVCGHSLTKDGERLHVIPGVDSFDLEIHYQIGTDRQPNVQSQVEAVLNVIAPFVDGPPGTQPQRWPVIRFDYEGTMVMPNDDQVRTLAEQIVTAIRTGTVELCPTVQTTALIQRGCFR